MTKVDPPNPMKKRRTARETAELTRPVQAHGIEAKARMKPMGMRAPYLSQRGPLTKRRKMVPATEQMLDVLICFFVRPSVSDLLRIDEYKRLVELELARDIDHWKMVKDVTPQSDQMMELFD